MRHPYGFASVASRLPASARPIAVGRKRVFSPNPQPAASVSAQASPSTNSPSTNSICTFAHRAKIAGNHSNSRSRPVLRACIRMSISRMKNRMVNSQGRGVYKCAMQKTPAKLSSTARGKPPCNRRTRWNIAPVIVRIIALEYATLPASPSHVYSFTASSSNSQL